MRQRFLLLTLAAYSIVGAGLAVAEPGQTAIGKGKTSVALEGEMLRLKLPKANRPGPVQSQSLPRSSQEWAEQMLDPSRAHTVFKDSQSFVEWLDAITEPQFMTALATTAIDPKVYAEALSKITRPETVRSWAEFTDPILYLRWLATGTNPDFYKAIVERLASPGKSARWVQFGATAGPMLPMLKTATSADYPRRWLESGGDIGRAAANFAQPPTWTSWAAGMALGMADQAAKLNEWQRLADPAMANTPRYRY